MIKHVVLIKLKPGIPAHLIEKIEKGFGTLPAVIDEIREYTFGRDIVHSDRSYDFAMVSSFDDLDAMERYRTHPDHQIIFNKLQEVCESIFTVDFEC